MKIEVSIGRLVAHGFDPNSREQLVAALTSELRLVLAREFGQFDFAGTDPAVAGRAIGASLARAVTTDRVRPGSPPPTPPARRPH